MKALSQFLKIYEPILGPEWALIGHFRDEGGVWFVGAAKRVIYVAPVIFSEGLQGQQDSKLSMAWLECDGLPSINPLNHWLSTGGEKNGLQVC